MHPLYINYSQRDLLDHSDIDMYSQYLIVNGEHAYDSRVSCTTVTQGKHIKEEHRVILQDGRVKDLLTSYPIFQLPTTWQTLTFPIKAPQYKYLTSLTIDLKGTEDASSSEDTVAPSVYFYFDIDWVNWSEPWTIRDYAQKIEQIIHIKNIEA